MGAGAGSGADTRAGTGSRMDSLAAGNPAARISGQWTRLPTGTAGLYLRLQLDSELDGTIGVQRSLIRHHQMSVSPCRNASVCNVDHHQYQKVQFCSSTA